MDPADMDPLVIVGGVGERVDAVLDDLPPLAVAEVRAGPRLQFVDIRQQGHGQRIIRGGGCAEGPWLAASL